MSVVWDASRQLVHPVQRVFVANTDTPKDCAKMIMEGTVRSLRDAGLTVIAVCADQEFKGALALYGQDGEPLTLLRLAKETGRKMATLQASGASLVPLIKAKVHSLFRVDLNSAWLERSVENFDDVDILLAPLYLQEMHTTINDLLQANPDTHITSALRLTRDAILNGACLALHKKSKTWINDPELSKESLKTQLSLKGIGDATAGKILARRDSMPEHRFTDISEVAATPGVGPLTFELLQDRLCVDAAHAVEGRGTIKDASPGAQRRLAGALVYAEVNALNQQRSSSSSDFNDPESNAFNLAHGAYFSVVPDWYIPSEPEMEGGALPHPFWAIMCSTHALKNVLSNAIISGKSDDETPERKEFYEAFKSLLAQKGKASDCGGYYDDEGGEIEVRFTATELEYGDAQDAKRCRRMLSVETVRGLRAIGKMECAELVECAHYAIQAWDTRGIDMSVRIAYWVALKQWLLRGVDVYQISHDMTRPVKGLISVQTWEATLMAIDTTLQMGVYLTAKWGAEKYQERFNARICSMTHSRSNSVGPFERQPSRQR